jgi:hypothetical protein
LFVDQVCALIAEVDRSIEKLACKFSLKKKNTIGRRRRRRRRRGWRWRWS